MIERTRLVCLSCFWVKMVPCSGVSPECSVSRVANEAVQWFRHRVP